MEQGRAVTTYFSKERKRYRNLPYEYKKQYMNKTSTFSHLNAKTVTCET